MVKYSDIYWYILQNIYLAPYPISKLWLLSQLTLHHQKYIKLQAKSQKEDSVYEACPNQSLTFAALKNIRLIT